MLKTALPTNDLDHFDVISLKIGGLPVRCDRMKLKDGIGASISQQERSMPPDLDLNQLNTLIQSANAGWTAAQTSVSELPPDEQKRRLGYDPRGGEESLEQRMSASQAKLAAVKATIGATATAYDWRNVGGT